MKELDLAEQLHNELDREYSKRLFRAIKLGHNRAEQRYAERQRINDAAYFLFVFGTFERIITQRAEVAVKRRTSKLNYNSRRAWDTLLKGSKLNTTFLNRVRILLDPKTPYFQKIKDYYSVRNDLAHEGITTKTFSIPSVIGDLKSALRQMKR